MKKNFFSLAFLAATLLLMTSCGTSKSIAYIQNSDSINYDNSRYYGFAVRPVQ